MHMLIIELRNHNQNQISMKQKSIFRPIRNALIAFAAFASAPLAAQNVYDTYNPTVDSIVGTYTGYNINPGYEGEYQMFNNLLTPWVASITPLGWSISYKIEPVSFPFLPDCRYGDCGDSTSTTRNLRIDSAYVFGSYLYWHSFDDEGIPQMSNPTTLLTEQFTSTDSVGSTRDYLAHTIYKHTYYLHAGPTMDDPIIDSFSFVIDHTRGFMSMYPFRPNNGQG